MLSLNLSATHRLTWLTLSFILLQKEKQLYISSSYFTFHITCFIYTSRVFILYGTITSLTFTRLKSRNHDNLPVFGRIFCITSLLWDKRVSICTWMKYFYLFYTLIYLDHSTVVFFFYATLFMPQNK
jgi:hypothetical protein